ncbi:MAG: hypothetical protein AABM29_07140 [Actinomycetota bacterium]
MQSNRARAVVGVLLVAATVVLFVVLSGGDDDGDSEGRKQATTATEDKPRIEIDQVLEKGNGPAPVPTIAVKGGEPVGGVRDLSFASGDQVRFRVTSDIEGEVHVHGYEIEKPVTAGGSVEFDFPAGLEGGFEVELHHGGGETQIAELQVQPG